MKKQLLILFLATVFTHTAAAQNSVTGKIAKFSATPGGVLVKIESNLTPENCGADYTKPLLIDEKNQSMIMLALKSLEEDKEITIKTSEKNDFSKLCEIKKIVWK